MTEFLNYFLQVSKLYFKQCVARAGWQKYRPIKIIIVIYWAHKFRALSPFYKTRTA